MSHFTGMAMNNRAGSIDRVGLGYKSQAYNYGGSIMSSGINKMKYPQTDNSRISSSIPKKNIQTKHNVDPYPSYDNKRESNSSNFFSQNKGENKYLNQQQDSINKRSTPFHEKNYDELLRKQVGYTSSNPSYSISQPTIKPTIVRPEATNNNIFSSIITSTSNSSTKKLTSDSNKYQSSNPTNLIEMSMSSKSYMKQAEKFVGLSNLGNTCFMNTSLQLLINCNRFTRELLAFRDFKKSNSVSTVFKDLVVEYKKMVGSSYTAQISPREFKSVFERYHPAFSGYNQHDSQEFLRILLDDISNETNRADKIKFREIENDGKEKKKVFAEYHNFFKNRESSIVTDNFYGYFINSFTCLNCDYTSYTYERFMEIPIYLGKIK